MDAAVALIATSTLGATAQRLGIVVATVLVAFVLLAAGRRALARQRAAAILGALLLTPILLVTNIWHSPQLHPLRHHPLYAVAGALLAVAAIVFAAVLLRRRPGWIALAVIAALPFRLPISSGGQSSNLLIPLYVVVAAGALSFAIELVRSSASEDEPPAERLEWALAALVTLYAAQAAYSSDFTKALQQVVFFYVPFALLLVLLRRLRWDARLLRGCFAVLVGLSLVFVAVGFYEYLQRELLLNPRVISSNMLNSYFRVNSLFFDPNIYGRFLAIVMVAVTVAMLWPRGRRDVLLAAGALLILWGGLMTTISQSSIAALLLGLAVIASLRWNARRTAAVALALAAVGGVFVLAAGKSIRVDLSSSHGADKATTGRYELIKGGFSLFGDRPLQGFGPGSFAREYRAHRHSSSENAVSASHTIPITVAAEQGVLGLVAYLLLLAACFVRLFCARMRGSPAGIAVAAAFTGLVLHTLLYADFLEDPMTWTLLGLGTALCAPRRTPQHAA